ncbi:MAG: hypothetical protein LUC17_00910, partial [Oscillospiraceae bacterium]|nr:hypothetical protein [Oscillospiraceae bacterium]
DLPDGGTQSGGIPEGNMPGGDSDIPGNNARDGVPEDNAGGTLPGENGQSENAAGERPDETAAYSAGLTADSLAENLAYDSGSAAGAQVSLLAAGGSDSSGYSTFQEMVDAYRSDIDEIEAGDRYGNNIVSLYNPLNYIGAEGTDDPVWTRIVMGAQEGDMSMFASLNLEINWLNAGTDSEIEWQWDGGHVPSEVLSGSFSLYVDQMYAEHAGGVEVETPAAQTQTTNGTATSATGTDLSGWVDYSDIHSVSFSLASAVAYRAKGASKAVPGFDVIDYGQEDYVFGSAEKDARHWDVFVLDAFESHGDVLEPLFNGG